MEKALSGFLGSGETMSNWIPTNELRYYWLEGDDYDERILQQKWVLKDPYVYESEWRDVPVVEEE